MNIYELIDQGKGRRFYKNGEVHTFGDLKEEIGRLEERQHPNGGINIRLVRWPNNGQYVMVNPNGDVTANPVHNGDGNFLKIGNILDDSISELWDAYPFRKSHIDFYVKRRQSNGVRQHA